MLAGESICRCDVTNDMPTRLRSFLRLAVLGAAVACRAVSAQDIPVQSASRPPPPGGDDEIVVYGSVHDLRLQLLHARDAMLARWNEVNGDDKFDIHCKWEAPIGTRIKRESCVSNIWAELDAKIGQAFLAQSRREAGPPPGLFLGEQNYWTSKLREQWYRLANEDAGLRETMKRFGQAEEALDRLSPSRRSVSTVAPSEALVDGAQRAFYVTAGRKPWKHDLETRSFAIATPAGGIQGLTVTCKSATEQLEYRPNSEWTIPDDYGTCWLQVDATPSTAFTLYEFE
jgi:hypothetical protein